MSVGRWLHTLQVRLGADVNARGAEGATPLHWAADNGQPEAVRVLLELHAHPACADSKGIMPLHRATVSGNLEALRALVQQVRKPSPTGFMRAPGVQNAGEDCALAPSYQRCLCWLVSHTIPAALLQLGNVQTRSLLRYGCPLTHKSHKQLPTGSSMEGVECKCQAANTVVFAQWYLLSVEC